ncbi:MAG: hypothetical protein ACJ8CX_13530, partial [Microvirga sp.]
LLGLYNDEARLDHVGFTSTISNAERPALTKRLEKLKGGPGFTGDAPGGPSRWSTERSTEWVPLRPELVVEVRYDHVTGERAMLKVKRLRSADCVVGGFRYATNSDLVGSLLLGLYNDEGRLDHVGFTSTISNAERPALTKRLEKLKGGPGFTGDAPGGPSRWSTERSAEWVPLRPELVVEVRYDHVTGGRFRHGTKLLRWRPDKAPEQCTFEQMQEEARPGKLVRAILEA